MIEWFCKLWDKYQNNPSYEFMLTYHMVDDIYDLIVYHTTDSGLTYQVVKLSILDNAVRSENITVGHFSQISEVFNEIYESYGNCKNCK